MYLWILTFILPLCVSGQGNRGNPIVQSKVKIPKNADGSPHQVYLGFHVQAMGSFSSVRMSFDIDLYLQMSWKDERLRREGGPELDIISDFDSLSEIWVPDVYVTNAKLAEFHTVTTPNLAVWLERDGTVAYSIRITMTVNCPLHLEQYPLDEQECAINFQSYGHTEEELLLDWFEKDAITYNEAISFPEYYFTGSSFGRCENSSYLYAKTNKGVRSGQFPCIQSKFSMRRAIAYHIIQTYVPTSLIVVISWVSFWIDRTAVPARITLSFTTLLTLSTMAAGVKFDLPQVSHGKAIDYWMLSCIAFVFGALVEFVFVNNLVRRSQHCQDEVKRMGAQFQTRLKSADEKQLSLTGKKVDVNHVVDTGCAMAVVEEDGNHAAQKALCVDKVCRVMFPLLFLIFNVLYWLIYTDVIVLSQWF